MRTTLTLEDDLAQQLERLARTTVPGGCGGGIRLCPVKREPEAVARSFDFGGLRPTSLRMTGEVGASPALA